MTPRERADKLHAGLLLWSGPLNHTWVAELIAETIEADRKEQIAISDIHDARVAELEQIRVDMIERARKAERERDEAIAAREELSRRYAALEVNYEEALTFRQAAIALGRERDEARAALAKTEQAIVDKLHCDMAAIVRLPCPHVEGRDQRIAELEAALSSTKKAATLYWHNSQCDNGCTGPPYCHRCTAVIAAFSGAPAQPAMAEKEEPYAYSTGCKRCRFVVTRGDTHDKDACDRNLLDTDAAPPSAAATHRLEDCGCIDKCPEHGVAADPLGIGHGTLPPAVISSNRPMPDDEVAAVIAVEIIKARADERERCARIAAAYPIIDCGSAKGIAAAIRDAARKGK